MDAGWLKAFNLDDSPRWATADLQLARSPTVVNDDVVIVPDGVGNLGRRLYFFRAGTGATVWSINGAGLSSPATFGFEAVGHSVGEGWLLVPFGNDLQAFRISATP